MGSEPITWIAATVAGETNAQDKPMPEVLAYHATTMSNTLASPIVCRTRGGNMPRLISHYRPNNLVYALTKDPAVQRNLSLYNGIVPLLVKTDEEGTALLKAHGVGLGVLVECSTKSATNVIQIKNF